METDYLLVAYKLSILAFYTGVLLYALPIPWPPLKRWAPRLIVDGVFTMGITLLFYTLFEVSDYISRLLGGSWNLLYTWLGTSLTSLIDMKAFIFLVGSVAGQLPLVEALNVMLRPLNRVVDLGLFVMGWVGALTYIVHDFGKALAAIGVALLAVPFRISRGAGAWLLSFILVFNAGLQVLPSFLASLAEQPGGPDPSQLEEYGLAFAAIEVKGYNGTPVGGGVLHLTIDESDLHANQTIVGSRAYDDYFSYNIPVPSRVSTYYTLEVDDVRVNLKPYPARPEDYEVQGSLWHITLKTSYLVWIGNYTIAYTNGSLTGIGEANNTKILTVLLDPGEYISIRYPGSCSVNVTSSGGLNRQYYNWHWHGLDGVEVRLLAEDGGEYQVGIRVEECGEVNPVYGGTVNYFRLVSGMGAFMDSNLLTSILLYYSTIPLVYIFTLFSVTFGLARLLGGRERIPIRI